MKYTDALVALIKGASDAGLPDKVISAKAKVPYSTVRSIMAGRQRAQVEPDHSVSEALEALFNRREPT